MFEFLHFFRLGIYFFLKLEGTSQSSPLLHLQIPQKDLQAVQEKVSVTQTFEQINLEVWELRGNLPAHEGLCKEKRQSEALLPG